MRPIKPGAPGTSVLASPADKRRAQDTDRAADGTTSGTPFLTSVFLEMHEAGRTLALGVRRQLDIIEGGSPKGSVWKLVAQPRFRLYFAASVTSNFGTWLQNGAQ